MTMITTTHALGRQTPSLYANPFYNLNNQRQRSQGVSVAARSSNKSSSSKSGKPRQSRESNSPDIDKDVELFNISSGWNVEALAQSSELLDQLDGWTVDSFVEDDDDDDVDDTDEFEGKLPARVEDLLNNIEDWDDDDDIDTSGMEVRSFTLADLTDSDEEDDDDGFVVVEEAAEAVSTSSTKQAASTSPTSTSNGGKVSAEDALLASIPKHMLRRLKKQQAEADVENAKTDPRALKKAAARQKTHKRLKIISGTAAGRRLFSPQGDQTRPMMEMVRGAVFSMITNLYGTTESLPEETRWLDLFGGTGAVGIEALSRGCSEAHFVELSPWVVNNCLMKNLVNCGVEDLAVVHTGRAEDFLQRAKTLPRFAGGCFDFISVCPPYELVSYPELYDLLEGSPLVHDETIIIVEYPKRLAHEVRPKIGPLVKLRDRKYGRTFIAIYGPGGDDDASDSDEE